MVDILSISTLIVAGLGALGACIANLHLRKCNVFGACIESDCSKRTPPPTPSEPNVEETSVA
jgi:hypothetical protein